MSILSGLRDGRHYWLKQIHGQLLMVWLNAQGSGTNRIGRLLMRNLGRGLRKHFFQNGHRLWRYLCLIWVPQGHALWRRLLIIRNKMKCPMEVNQTLPPATPVLVQWAHEWSGHGGRDRICSGSTANATVGNLACEHQRSTLRLWYGTIPWGDQSPGGRLLTMDFFCRGGQCLFSLIYLVSRSQNFWFPSKKLWALLVLRLSAQWKIASTRKHNCSTELNTSTWPLNQQAGREVTYSKGLSDWFQS